MSVSAPRTVIPIVAPERVDPPEVSDERTGLETWLDYQRATLLTKCDGLDGAELSVRSCPPSTLTLLGLVRHMAEVERHWFLRGVGGLDAPPLFYTDEEPDGDFDLLDPARAAEDFDVLLDTVQTARSIAAARQLDDVFVSGRERHITLRWIYVHMIEEYARHNGHADLLRQAIDGVTGD